MRKKWIQKLRSKAGETIGETLIATLIAALALTMLAGAIGSSAKIINGSRDAMQSYRAQNAASLDEWKTQMNSLQTASSYAANSGDPGDDTGLIPVDNGD